MAKINGEYLHVTRDEWYPLEIIIGSKLSEPEKLEHASRMLGLPEEDLALRRWNVIVTPKGIEYGVF